LKAAEASLDGLMDHIIDALPLLFWDTSALSVQEFLRAVDRGELRKPMAVAEDRKEVAADLARCVRFEFVAQRKTTMAFRSRIFLTRSSFDPFLLTIDLLVQAVKDSLWHLVQGVWRTVVYSTVTVFGFAAEKLPWYANCSDSPFGTHDAPPPSNS
jgi:hypothetical protein